MDISLPYSSSTLLCYSVLYLAVACLWLPASIWGQPLWLILAASAGFIALISGQLTPLGLGLAALYLFIAYLFSRTTGAKKKWLTLLLAALSVLFGAHLLPGFQNLKVLDAMAVSADGLPFTMYLNLDKTLVALGLLGWCVPRLSRRQEWRQLLQVLLSLSLLFLLLIFILALTSGKVHWDPKLPSYTLLWMLTNLLFVCTAEEAFFRGFLQQQLALLWKNRPLQQELPLALASLVYGLSHFAGGPLYIAFISAHLVWEFSASSLGKNHFANSTCKVVFY